MFLLTKSVKIGKENIALDWFIVYRFSHPSIVVPYHLLQPHEISARQFCASENQVAGGTRRYQKLFSYLSSKFFWGSPWHVDTPRVLNTPQNKVPPSPLKPPPPRFVYLVSGASVKTTQSCKAFVGAGIPGIPSPEPAVWSWFKPSKPLAFWQKTL